MGYWKGDVRRGLVRSVASLWAFVYALFVPLFRVFNKLFFRCEEVETRLRKLDENAGALSSSKVAVLPGGEKSNGTGAVPVEAEEPMPDSVESFVSCLDELNRRESPKFLSFKFQTFEEFTISNCVDDRVEANSIVVLTDSCVEEEGLSSYSVKEPSCEHKDCSTDGICVSGTEISAKGLTAEQCEYGGEEDDKIMDDKVSEAELSDKLEGQIFSDKFVPRQFNVLTEKDLLMSDSDTYSMTSSHDFSIMSRLFESSSDGFFSDGDIEVDFSHVDEDLKEELRKLEESVKREVRVQENNHRPDGDLMEELESSSKPKNDEEAEGSPNSSSRSSESTAEPENQDLKMEAEWEHQELIEQLKMELRKVKATGLPTIAEDSEYPRITEDLKPLKIEEKLYRGDRCMLELHKVYKSYQERMRKFDILNYQKMYALGFLRVKDSFKSMSGKDSSASSLASLLSRTLRLGREDKSYMDDPMMELARELHGDLETVYVGQMCLSWEFLQWQYGKALELWDADPYSLCRYNEVANEFQQLQVLLQRFLETEKFEGPRVQYYVKSRCFLRGLLQVPVIREDNRESRKKTNIQRKSEFIVSSDVLVEILEESIRIFWRFIRADKDANVAIHKGRGQPVLLDGADMELFSEMQSTLQKKEKKMKEVLQGGNCILKKFKKHCRHHDEEDDSSSDQVLAFFSQVDMKLVRRVLNMSRLSSDQLAWCNEKLSKINLVSRRQIHIEPSFMLFPC